METRNLPRLGWWAACDVLEVRVKAGQRSVASGLGILGGFVLVAWTLSNGQVALGRVGQEVLWFLVVFLIVIPIHELGHALAGFLVGHRIRSVVIGVGRPLLVFNLAGVAVTINLLPLGGLTMGTPRTGGWLRVRLWVFAAGGPAANLLLCYVLRRVYGHGGHLGHLGSDIAEQHRLATTAASASWSVLLLNLIPFKTGEGQGSDGYSLFTIPFWKAAQIEEARFVVEALPLIEALRRDDIDAAGPLAETLAARLPDYRLAIGLIGTVRHNQGRHAEAVALWCRALAMTTNARQIAFLKNNIAFAEAVLGDPESYAEADAFSAAAMAAHPELTPFVGTRGAVLARLGRAAEALPLLQRAAATPTPDRSQAYNRASLASALAMLGRTAEARRELDAARRLNPACELLDAAEADLRAAPAAPVALPAATGVLPAIEWEKWGGLARWKQVARALAFVYTLAPLEGVSLGISTLLLALVVMLNPELAGLLAFGTCNLWLAATTHSTATETILTAVAGLVALALAAVRPRLGPSAPSKVPVMLAWVLGVLGVLPTVATPLGMAFGLLLRAIRPHRHVVPSALTLGLHSFRPPPFAAAQLVGWATVLLLSRRRWTRLFAIVPLGLALFSLSGARHASFQQPHFDHIPVDGAPIVWSAPRPAAVLRTAHYPGDKMFFSPVLAPGGRAFFSQFVDTAVAKKPRFGIRVRDFEGHVVELDGTAAAFVDDQRMLLVRRPNQNGIELCEVRPFSSTAPVWTRRLPSFTDASVSVESTGEPIVLSGPALGTEKPLIVRTDFGPDARLHFVPSSSRASDADLEVGFFLTTDGQGGSVVSRQRDGSAKASSGGSPFVPSERRDDESSDLELWALRPEGETLLAAHLPHPECLKPTVGLPVLWCPVGWGDNRALLKIDGAAGRVSRIAGALPKWGRAAMIAPSKLVVVSYGQSGATDRLGVLDLDTRRGTWLTLPAGDSAGGTSENGTSLARAEPVQGGLATVVNEGEGRDATLTVYAVP
jgi:tetratricopeptide (TPR) repeat protein